MSVMRIRENRMRNSDAVLILLSTYNGEKYIREQLDSLFNQTVDVFVLVRDDGSTDGTTTIVEEYIRKRGNIKLIKGQNIGFIASFSELVCNAVEENYEWMAFCDQDDIWLENKLEVALRCLKEKGGQNKPLLYSSSLTTVDSDLRVMGKIKKAPERSQRHALIYDIAGCTCVFNYAAVELYQRGINSHMIAHDRQMYCVCYYMGEVYIDKDSYILYRQHGNNTIGCCPTKGFLQGVIDIVKDLTKKQESKWIKHYEQFLFNYENYLSPKEKKQLRRFVSINDSILSRFLIFADLSIRTDSFKQTIAFKIRALLNRMY